jgi:hypothetical protein
MGERPEGAVDATYRNMTATSRSALTTAKELANLYNTGLFRDVVAEHANRMEPTRVSSDVRRMSPWPEREMQTFIKRHRSNIDKTQMDTALYALGFTRDKVQRCNPSPAQKDVIDEWLAVAEQELRSAATAKASSAQHVERAAAERVLGVLKASRSEIHRVSNPQQGICTMQSKCCATPTPCSHETF